ncbi:MAG: hypothetical protein HOV83_33115 [Catenulispora sp.]|nr:hypothetical protein [Catenulispora sp.]
MSVADRDRLVFEEYADLDRHLAGVWRRERLRVLVCRWCWCLVVGVARAGLSMVGISPYEVDGAGPRTRPAAASHADSGGSSTASSATSSGTSPDTSSAAGSAADAEAGEGDR